MYFTSYVVRKIIFNCEVNYKNMQRNYEVFSARKVSPYTVNDIKEQPDLQHKTMAIISLVC